MFKKISSTIPWACAIRGCSKESWPVVSFASQAAELPQLASPHFYTLECNPVKHNMNHEAKFYRIPLDVHKSVFHLKVLPTTFEKLSKTFKEHCIMVRKPALEIISHLENADYSMPAIRYVLYGKLGCGKSLILSHILHYGYEKKWILLHIPNTANWVRRPKETAPSISNPDQIDLPVNSAIWLQQFQSQNSARIKELNLCLSKTYNWGIREKSEEGQPLLSLVELGVTRIKYASDCIAVILKELKEQSQQKGFNVLVTVNGVNSFFMVTNIQRENKSWVLPNDVTIVRAFRKLFKADWHNAAIVVTVDSALATVHPTRHCRDVYTPKILLEKEGFEHFDPFVPVLVPPYSEKEIESCLDYYTDRMWIQNEHGKTEQGRAELKFLSGHVPYKLMEMCGPL